MKILYFDCFSGISGDMTLAALLDLGVEEQRLRDELNKLRLKGYRLEIGKKIKNGIIGTDVNVVLTDEDEEILEDTTKNNQVVTGEDKHHHHNDHDHHHAHSHHHDHDHQHDHDYDHAEGHKHNHIHRHHTHDYSSTHQHSSQHADGQCEEAMHDDHHHHEHHHGRNLDDIVGLIKASDLKEKVKEFSIRVFEEIAKAEAKVHDKPLHEVHFHEVGAVDSIVDIVGAAICLDLLGVDAVYASPLYDGQGFINCQHGTIPVPVPAVMAMLAGSDIPLIQTEARTELVTPTGMGIIKCLAEGFGKMPAIKILNAGYGMGKRETGGFNALRVVLGEALSKGHHHEDIVLLETNIDNMSSELLGYTMEALLEAGALDVFHTPIYMKKNRPAVLLSVLTAKETEKSLVELLLKETTTLGIRRTIVSRYCMHRKIHEVDTALGKIRVKVAHQGEIIKAAPEYEDCAAIARKTGLPLRRVYEVALEASRDIK